MEFFNSAIEVLQTLVVALGAGLGVWGAVNLLEGLEQFRQILLFNTLSCICNGKAKQRFFSIAVLHLHF